MSTKELQEEIVKNMKRWQAIEDSAVASTGKIIEKTDNPLIRIVMEIIQNDSQTHHRVQEFIARTMEEKPVTITPEDLEKVLDEIDNHIRIEEKTVEMAEKALEALKGRKMVVPEYLINYLLRDENKHNALLSDLSIIKKNMYPYGG
jgi:rubrerythrin